MVSPPPAGTTGTACTAGRAACIVTASGKHKCNEQHKSCSQKGKSLAFVVCFHSKTPIKYGLFDLKGTPLKNILFRGRKHPFAPILGIGHYVVSPPDLMQPVYGFALSA